MMTLRERCLSLSYNERLNMCIALLDSVIQKRPPIGNRAKTLLSCMEDILGEPVPVGSRKANHVWARAFVTHQLLQEGFTVNEIARMMDMNHGSIIHLRAKMQDALDYPLMFNDIITLWDKFQKTIEP